MTVIIYSSERSAILFNGLYALLLTISNIFLMSAVGIGFSPTLYQVDEDGRAGVVAFRVENRNPDREGQYRVQFTTIEGTARGLLVE